MVRLNNNRIMITYNFKEKNEEEVRKYIETNKCVSDKMVKI